MQLPQEEEPELFCVCACVSPPYLIHEDFVERDNVWVTLTKLQDGNLTSRAIPEKATSQEKH